MLRGVPWESWNRTNLSIGFDLNPATAMIVIDMSCSWLKLAHGMVFGHYFYISKNINMFRFKVNHKNEKQAVENMKFHDAASV